MPASRIIGGYTVKDGVIVPRYSHGEIIEAVFRRTRVTVGLMTAAKLLSAVEPVIRYQRGRFRGGESVAPGSPRYELGLQQKEDALHRLVDIWATGEAAASLGFAAARLFDELDPLERRKDELFAAQGISGGTRPASRLSPGAEGRPGVPRPRRQSPRPRGTPSGIRRSRRDIAGAVPRSRTPWRTSSALPASCGTPATAPT